MSTTIQNNQAASGQGGFATTGARRIKYGTNVLIMCIAALVILAMVNFVAFRKHWRKDMAAAGSYQPSERTKRILDQVKGKVSLTSVYTSTQEESSRDKYLPAVEDYCQELQQCAPAKIDVEHVTNDTQKQTLLGRIQGKYSTQAKAFSDLIDQFDAFAGVKDQGKAPATQPALPQLRQALTELSTALNIQDSYLGSFPQVADVEAKLTKTLETLANTPAEIKRLTKSGGIPRYGEARDKINQSLDALRETLAAGQKGLKEISEVSQAANEEFFRTAPQRMSQMDQMMQTLQDTVGKSEDRDLPADTRAALQAYAKESQQIAIWLNEEAGKQEALVKKYPAIGEMSNWLVRQDMGIIQQVIPLPVLMRSMADQQMNVRQQIREILTAQIAPDEIAGAIRKLRQLAGQHVQISRAVGTQVIKLAQSLNKADEASLVIIEQGKGGAWQADVISRIDAMKAQIAKLPELKLTEVSDKLEAANTIVVEMGDKMQVLTFDEVWPQSDPMRGMQNNNEAPRRAFNGDTTISGAILSLSQPPVATVVFVHYAGEIPPQMRQYMPPNVGSIPYEALETLRNLLGKANLSVKEWNLAKENEPPQLEKDARSVYVFLPPPQDMPPMGPQGQQQHFGQAQLDRVKKLLASGAKAIFLCRWEGPTQRSPFMPPMESRFGYAELLRDSLGVDVATNFRTIYGVLESREGSKYGVNIQRWLWMPMNNFTDLAIGKPLQGRRVLMSDVCPIDKASKMPDGLKIEPILTTPSNEEYWATKDVMELIRSVVSEKQGGLVTQGPADRKAPFPVAVAVTNTRNEPTAVVLGTGGSVIDNYMNERIPRLGDRNQSMRYDPPPTANADLVVNSALWLSGRVDLIGAGPVIMPPVRPVPRNQMLAIYALVWGILPGVVILSGAAMYFVRRR